MVDRLVIIWVLIMFACVAMAMKEEIFYSTDRREIGLCNELVDSNSKFDIKGKYLHDDVQGDDRPDFCIGVGRLPEKL